MMCPYLLISINELLISIIPFIDINKYGLNVKTAAHKNVRASDGDILFIPTVDRSRLMLKLSVISQKFNQIVVLLATSARRHRRSHVKHVLSGSNFKHWQGPLEDILVDSALSAIITGQTFPAAIQSEAPSGEPNNTTDQVTKSRLPLRMSRLKTNLAVTNNNLQEPLLLYDHIVAGEVTVAATVCSEHRFIYIVAQLIVSSLMLAFRLYVIIRLNIIL